ncbi:unnamed protein product [Auanema sp. JU1783]|nr:unnamed protein product [Auanema sp. JU1783]
MAIKTALLFLIATFVYAESRDVLRFPSRIITKENIIADHESVPEDETSYFNGASLAYVTPWNNKGYDLAKITADKLSHISPVWLQLKPTSDEESCHITGDHDIDHGWMEDLKTKNPDVKIVPRVLFEEWSINSLVEMMNDEKWSHSCMNVLRNLITRHRFDGVVLEVWSAAMLKSQGKIAPLMIEFLSSWGDSFNEKDLETVVVVGAPLFTEYRETGMFTASHLYQLGPRVDYIQMMTYDFPSSNPSGVAPYEWIEKSIQTVLDGSQLLAKKLMIGINYYGYEYPKGGGQHSVKYDKYLELLKSPDTTLDFDIDSLEHMLKTPNSVVYYPSIASIELRMKLAEEYGVGIAIWDYGQGFNYFTKLL